MSDLSQDKGEQSDMEALRALGIPVGTSEPHPQMVYQGSQQSDPDEDRERLLLDPPEYERGDTAHSRARDY
jgi:hypothetical protein